MTSSHKLWMLRCRMTSLPELNKTPNCPSSTNHKPIFLFHNYHSLFHSIQATHKYKMFECKRSLWNIWAFGFLASQSDSSPALTLNCSLSRPVHRDQHCLMPLTAFVSNAAELESHAEHEPQTCRNNSTRVLAAVSYVYVHSAFSH